MNLPRLVSAEVPPVSGLRDYPPLFIMGSGRIAEAAVNAPWIRKSRGRACYPAPLHGKEVMSGGDNNEKSAGRRFGLIGVDRGYKG